MPRMLPDRFVPYRVHLNHFIVLTCCLFFATLLSAQEITVTGLVTSAEDGEPLIGANVVDLQTQDGTVTGIDGRFSLRVNDPNTNLQISYVGFTETQIALDQRSEISVSLSPVANMLEDVVVTGYRREIRSDVSSSITSLKAENIENLVVTGVDQALQGQAPGVQVTQVTGSPGEDIAIRIRGAGTLGNNRPLFVIDGIPTTENINMFAPSDIASIEILKDGAAAAIYGARAANGVVLITTKRGASGPAQFNFESYVGLQQPVNLPELLNAEEYLQVRNDAIRNANELRNPANQIASYDPSILDTLPDNDWLDLVFDPALMQRYALSARGGGESGTYYLSGEYLSQDGIFQGQGFEKYQARFNGEIGKNRFRVGNSLSFSHTDRQIIGASGDGFGAGNELSGIRYALIAAPVVPIRYPNGEFVNVTSELREPTLFGDGNANPLVFVRNTDWNQKRYRVFGNLYAEYRILEGLNVRTTLGGDLQFEREKLFKERLSDAIYSPTSLNEGRVFRQTLVWNNTLDFQREFGQHRVSALLGMEAIENHTDFLGASASNFRSTDDLFRYLDGSVASELNDLGVSGIATEWALLSYFTQLSYSFNRRYVISAAVRRDGSSRFGQNNRWGVFPSVSAAWNLHNEPFFENVGGVSSLKIRGSWGQLGNQEIGIYPYSSLVRTGEFVYPFGGAIATGASIVEIGNENVRWETSTQTNLGLDASFWQDRISFVMDVFRKTTEDILVRVPTPRAGGPERPPFVNAATVRNQGIELGLSYRNRINELNYDLGFNFSAIRNEVTDIAGSEPILGGFGLSDGALTKTEPGFPIGSFFLYETAGIFQSEEEVANSPFQTQFTRPGDVKFADLNGDDIIDDKDRRHVGNPFPDFSYGVTLGINWRGLDFSTLVQGVQGNDIYFLYGNFAYETQARGFNSYADILNAWTPDNRDTDIPIVSLDDRNGNRRPSTRFLEDGSYLRVRNVTLGYDLKRLFATDQIAACRLYFTVQNALTFTNYPGLDPEIHANSNDTRGLGLSPDLAVGIDWGTVPAPRIFTVGFNLGF